jgi:tetratricopeptide (TPR) repeat protein
MIIHLRNTFLALTGRRPAIFAAIFVMGAWMWPITMGHNQSAWAADETIQLLPLLEATESQEAVSRDLGAYKYADPKTMPPDLRPLWPIYSFLWAEIYRLRGDTAQARQIYRDLVEWSATTPYEDEWGGSGLAIVALWRCTQLANASPKLTTLEKGILLDKITELWKDQPRLGQGMFQTLPYLPALPQLRENLLRQSSSLAWSLNRKEEAQRFFIEYLGVATTGQLTPTEQELLAAATSEGMLSMPKVALFLGKRLDKLGDYQGASFWLNKAIETGKAQVRADASLSLARLERQKEPCLRGKVQKLLDTAVEESTDPNVIQEGLYLKAKIAIREGCPKDYPLFQKDLQQILQDFPRGRRADDALFELASYRLDRYRDEEDPADLDAALGLFAQLRRDYPDREDYIDSSRFKPALALYTHGKPEELRQATALLQKLEKARPDGPLHLAALFWLGRIAAESGQDQQARTYFATIIKECPYDYYATRARMHLNLGNQAARQFNPDAKTREELHAAFVRSKEQPQALAEKSPYHLRLQAAVQSGVYYRALNLISISGIKNFLPAVWKESLWINWTEPTG